MPSEGASEPTYTLYRRGLELLEDGDFEHATAPLAQAAPRAPEKSSIRGPVGAPSLPPLRRLPPGPGRVRGSSQFPPGQRLRPLLPRPPPQQDRPEAPRPPPPGPGVEPAARTPRLPLLPPPARRVGRLGVGGAAGSCSAGAGVS